MEKLSASQLRATLKTLLAISQCPVCLEILTPETVQCINGHPLCVSCQERMASAECPVCRNAFSNVRPTGFIHQIIQALPHPCRYQDCNYFVKTDDDHEKYCGYKPTKCKWCDWSGAGKMIRIHVLQAHLTLDNKSPGQSDQPFDPKQEGSSFHPIFVQDQFFWGEMKNIPFEKTLTVIFHTIPNGKTYSVYQGHIQLKFLNKKHTVETVLNMDPDVDSSLENCITIPSSILPKYISNHKLQYTLSITKDKWASVQNGLKANKFLERIKKKN